MNLFELIPEYQEWKSVNSKSHFFSYLTTEVNITQLFMAAQLFFPETIIIDNCLFIKESRNTVYMESHWKNAKSAASLEKIINDVCFGIFYIIKYDNEDKIGCELIHMLKDSWDMTFLKRYPDRKIVTEIYEDEEDGWGITAYQEENLSKPKPAKMPVF